MHGMQLPRIWPGQQARSREVLRTLTRAVHRAAATARTTRDLTSSNIFPGFPGTAYEKDGNRFAASVFFLFYM